MDTYDRFMPKNQGIYHLERLKSGDNLRTYESPSKQICQPLISGHINWDQKYRLSQKNVRWKINYEGILQKLEFSAFHLFKKKSQKTLKR